MTDTTDPRALVERLRSIPPRWVDTAIGTEAAGALTAALDENDRLRKALKPFAGMVDKSTCNITVIWEDGDYRSTYTGVFKPCHFYAAHDAMYPAHGALKGADQ